MVDIIKHGEELTYEIEEAVDKALKYGIDENLRSKIFRNTSRLRSVLRNAKAL